MADVKEIFEKWVTDVDPEPDRPITCLRCSRPVQENRARCPKHLKYARDASREKHRAKSDRQKAADLARRLRPELLDDALLQDIQARVSAELARR